MTLTREELREAASDLPDGMSCTNSRERLLCVAEILCTLSDEDHLLSNADIRDILQARFPDLSRVSENTIAADIDALDGAHCLGLKVLPPKGKRTRGVYMERPALPPKKIRLLLNAVQSSRFLTVEQSADLQEALLDLMSRWQGDLLERQVFVNQRIRKGDPSVFDTCDIIAECMNRGRKVSFEYTFTGFDGKPHLLLTKKEERTRCETVLGLFFSEGKYYVETYTPDDPYEHGVKTMRCRVDRMQEVKVSDEPADKGPEVDEARNGLKARFEESFEMVDGDPRVLFLRVRSEVTNIMADRFGYQLEYHDHQGPYDKDGKELTCVRVAGSFTFYRWLSSAGEDIVMEEPPKALTLANGWWKDVIGNKSRDDLVKDYQEMKEGFLKYLDAARAPYIR